MSVGEPKLDNLDIEYLTFDYERLHRIAKENNSKFSSAKPFPHICIDNFLEEESYITLRDNFIKGRRSSLPSKDTCEGKLNAENRVPATIATHIFPEFSSAEFLLFLSILSGIDKLKYDKHWLEAGYIGVKRAGHLQSHVDYTHHRISGLERRLNLFIYLNDDWKEEYGGALSLFDIGGEKAQSFLPIANRCVIFQASDIAFHGHTEPLNCPQGMLRKAFAAYYYTESTGRSFSKIIFQKSLKE